MTTLTNICKVRGQGHSSEVKAKGQGQGQPKVKVTSEGKEVNVGYLGPNSHIPMSEIENFNCVPRSSFKVRGQGHSSEVKVTHQGQRSTKGQRSQVKVKSSISDI